MPPPPPTVHNGPKRDSSASQLLQELEGLSLALNRSAPPRDPPPSSSGKLFNLSSSRRNAGKSALPRRSAAFSAHATSLDPAEKAHLQSRLSTSSLFPPPTIARDRSVHDGAGLQLSQSQSLDSQAPAVGNLKAWVQDSIDFSQKLEASQQRQQDKKGFWKWKPFRAIAHMGQQRFHVIFSLHVHRIEGLPASVNGLRLTVHWNRKEEGTQTKPSRVLQGVAEFDETLRQRCTVYGTKNADQRIKYESKMFALSVLALDVGELEFGKHHFDLSRLLPEFRNGMDEDEKPSSWKNNFELTGVGKGSSLVVTFNYDLVHHEATEESDAQIERSGSRRSSVLFNSVPSSAHGSPQEMSSGPSVSPSRSEPGADPDNRVAMEYLSLDDRVGPNSTDQFAEDDNLSPINGLPVLHGDLLDFKPTLKYFRQGGEKRDEDIDFTFPSIRSEQGEARHSNRTVTEQGEDDETYFDVEDAGIELELENEDQHFRPREHNLVFSKVESGRVGKDLRESHESENAMDNKQDNKQDNIEKSAGEEGLFKGSRPRTEDVLPSDFVADLDDELDLVAGEFFNLLEVECAAEDSKYDSEADSPRARLLKQFEREAFLEGSMGLAFEEAVLAEGKTNGTEAGEQLISKGSGVGRFMEDRSQHWVSGNTLELASIMEAAESELQKATQTMRSKSRAKILEDAETEALFQQWGLNEKSFESSPPRSTALGSPFYPAQSRLSAPPPLASGLGSVIQLRDGGSLRSMSPSHFPRNRSKGSLVMQVSRPVVVPSAAGSSATDMLRHLASFGTNNLATQAMAAMPLDDITGMTPEEVAAPGVANLHEFDHLDGPSSQGRHRCQNAAAPDSHGAVELSFNQAFTNRKRSAANMQPRKTASVKKFGRCYEPGMSDGYVSLEDLAPLAMQDLEALAISGLKVQADVAEEEAPSYLDAAAWGILDSQKKHDRAGLGTSQGVAGIHFGAFEHEAHKASVVKCDDPLSMALTLEEWSRLDAGAFDDVDSKNKTLAVLSAHKVHHPEWELAQWEETKAQKHRRKVGIMGNTLMIAMLVQLRDPFRNYEPVGAPMMALVQAERVMAPHKAWIGRNVSAKGNSKEDDDLQEVALKNEDDDLQKVTLKEEEEVPQFKIQGVHIAGLKTGDDDVKKGKGEQDKKKGWGFFGWGNRKQQQSGSLWLAAQGMGKTSKPALLKSKPPSTSTKVKPGESLWSISARVHGSGEKWRDIAALNPHIRNPDVIFPDDNIRTR